MKRYIAVVLLPLLISSWLGIAVWKNDPSGDSRIDLEDAILLMKDFARTAQNPGTFRASIENLVSTLREVAGLKTAVKPPKDTHSGSTSSSLYLPYLASSYSLSTSSDIWSEVPEAVFYCESAESKPMSPPPKAA